MLDPSTDYSPDLEWMLKSGQASDSLIVETLVQEYYDRIYRFCLSALHNSDSAHQATQDSFVYTVRHAHRYRSQESVQSWLYRAANHCCQKFARLPDKRVEPGTPDHDENSHWNSQPDGESGARFYQALQALNPDDRQLLFLSDVVHLNPEEIAQVFQKESREVEQWLGEVWEKLGRHLDELPDRETCTEALEGCWPPCSELDEIRQTAIEAILEQAGRKSLARIPLWQIGGALVLGILLIGFLASGLGSAFFSEPKKTTATPRVLPESEVPGENAASSGARLNLFGSSGKEKPEEGSISGNAEIAISERLALQEPSETWDASLERSGPASLAAVLNFWGWKGTSEEVTLAIQPNPDDVTAMPYELIRFVEEATDLKAIFRVGGDADLLRALVKAGFPVIIQRRMVDESGDWMAGFQIVTGYEQEIQGEEPEAGGGTSARIALYPESAESYQRFNRDWRAFNYLILLVYPQKEQAHLMEVLGPQADPSDSYRMAAERASEESYSLSGADRFFALFNRGTSLAFLEDYPGAASAYDEAFLALDRLPESDRLSRILWYQSRPYWVYYNTGRYGDVIRLADTAIGLSRNAVLEESYYWRGLAKEALGDLEGAVADLEESLYLNPNFSAGLFHLDRIKRGDS